MDSIRNPLRKTGIDVLGDIPWGTHLCQFYETKEDLLQLLVPYFKTGLENNEFCLWVTYDPVTIEEAFNALQEAIPNFTEYVEKKSIEIFSCTSWYINSGKFDSKIVNDAWLQKLQSALSRGFDGMRVNGNETWLDKNHWSGFMQYERALNDLLNDRKMIVLCTYPLIGSDAKRVLDVAHAHQCVISCREGHWEILEEPQLKKKKADLIKKNKELDALVAERTNELEKAVRELKKEIAEREKIEQELRRSELRYNGVIEQASDAIIITDEHGQLAEVNTSFCKMVDYSENELIGLDLTTLIDSERVKTDPADLLSEGKSLFRERVMRKRDGTAFPIEEHITMLSDKRILAIVRDISERKRTELKLIEAEAKFRNLIEQIITGVYIIQDEKFLYINPRFAEIFGYKEEELIESFPVKKLIHPDDRAMVAEQIRVRVEGEKESVHYEAKGLKKNGEVIWIEVFCSGRLKEKSRAIMGTLLDITGRKHAEEKVRQSESLLVEAEHLANVGSWSLDLRSNKVTWSDELYRIFGVKPSEFDHSLEAVLGFTHPDDRDFIQSVVERAVKTRESYNFFYRMIRRNGEERILHVRGAVATDEQGSAVRMYGAVQDVTERKRAEDELRLAYQRLSYHVENTPLAVIEFDNNLFIKRWSKRAEEIFGWNTSEAHGKNVYDLDFPIISKDDIQIANEINEQLMKGRVDRNMSLHRNYTKSGKAIYCEWYNSALRDELGNVITVLSLIHDVTERKEAEEKLKESYIQIRSLSEHLQKIREEERTHVAREIHDELGQKLTVMKMDVSWLNKKISDDNYAIKERLHDLIDIIDSTVQSVRRILYELRPHLLDLGLEEAMEWHLKEFEKRSGIKTYFNEPGEKLELNDSIKTGLFRIFQESLTNIARHSNASHVHVDLVQTSEQLFLRIKDNGKGFDKQKFNEKSTLGILGMKERAGMMGGSYEINSESGNGTTVTVRVPLVNKSLL